MKIGIDGNEANVEKKVGISEFAFELLIEFAKLKKENISFEVFLKNTKREELPNEFAYTIVKPSKLWTQIGLPLHLFTTKDKPDVFFSPTHYAPRFSPIPTVISIMDISYIKYPNMFRKSDLYQLKNWTDYSIRQASCVITISKSSKDDIINAYKISEEKVHVVYPGIKLQSMSNEVEASDTIKSKYKIEKKFILFVGTLQPRKNIERLIEAYSKLKEKKDLELVIIGKKGWLFEEILLAPQKFHVSDSVKFLEYVPDVDLPLFYKKAECFVLPSLYEGFGLPILEAMKYECPVITSCISSLPEAGGDAALYVDPFDIEQITDTIAKVVSDKKLRVAMIAKGKQHIKKFSWEKSAKQVLEILEATARK